MKSIYTIYKERLIEISGKSRSIYSKKGNTKFSCDIIELLGGNNDEFNEFIRLFFNKGNATYPLVSRENAKNLYDFLKHDEKIKSKREYAEMLSISSEEANKYLIKCRNREIKEFISTYVNTFSKLKKEIDDLARETGRYELYVGYPFVCGNIGEDTQVKAPLMLFPVKINLVDDSNITVEPISDMPVILNKPLIFAYANERKINVENMEMEFNNFSSSFKSVDDLLKYLKSYNIRFDSIDYSISSFDSSGDPNRNSELKIVGHCILGRYPLANSIYNDYTQLEKKRASTNSAIDELIYAKSPKRRKKEKINSLYSVYKLDYAQEKAIESINNDGNMVIYGPPGTGKSQTIVNIITDALARKKRVLVVSQKKAALDVVYNRLGKVKDRAMFIVDPEKEREFFYKRCLDSHINISSVDTSNYYETYSLLQEKINKDYKELEKIFDVLYESTEFGASLENMYEQSSQISKNSYDYQIYEEMIKREDLLSIKYDDLNKAIENIKYNDRKSLYYKYLNIKSKNCIVEYLHNDLDIYTIDNALNKIDNLSSHFNAFNTAKYPYGTYLVAYCINHGVEEMNDFSPLIKMIAKQEDKKGFILPSKFEKELEVFFEKAYKDVKEELKTYSFLKDLMNDEGYKMMVNAILNGNTTLFKNLKQALGEYTKLRDIKLELTNLGEVENKLLAFAYELSETVNSKYNQIVDNFMPIRMYKEIVEQEKARKEDLAKIMNFNNLKTNILETKNKQNEVALKIAESSFNKDCVSNFRTNKNNKDFLYQINKQQNNWPIRKFMGQYLDLMLDLYPCWLLSPENVSTIMPLVKNMFDLVLVDEASQVFIENTLPIIYRAKNVVIAGDSKQLKPTSVFMKRYMGSDVEEGIDATTEAALEVESLLDLATSRLHGANLNYHYRSKNAELIDFSNNYFYDSKLQIVPNLVKGKKNAIIRYKVNGRWINRRNDIEAKAVIDILKKVLKERKNKESIGIITFNSEQAYAIEEGIRRECKNDLKFAETILQEQNRFENNVDISLFIKNLENVQGDERDIIILSVGYAYNDNGRVIANFGSLSTEGGENRLNVAITRAKERIYLVTSIEPEELNVENTKNEGPKILKKYLSYTKAISSNNLKEAKIWLNSKKEDIDDDIDDGNILAKEIKSSLEKNGYCVEVKIGNTRNKIDLAVFDPTYNQYLLGIECINKDYKNMDEMIENQIYHQGFLQSRGWKIHRVWTRDWWLSKNKVINSIIREIENAKKELIKANLDSKK